MSMFLKHNSLGELIFYENDSKFKCPKTKRLVLMFYYTNTDPIRIKYDFMEDNIISIHKKRILHVSIFIIFMQCATFEMFPRFEGPFFHVQCKDGITCSLCCYLCCLSNSQNVLY